MTLLQTLLEYSVVLSLAYLALLAAVTVVLALRLGGRREEPADDYDTLSASRFTIPVSLIVPLRDDSGPVAPTLTALLGLSYPEFEVIVVAEGLPAAAWSALKDEWAEAGIVSLPAMIVAEVAPDDTVGVNLDAA